MTTGASIKAFLNLNINQFSAGLKNATAMTRSFAQQWNMMGIQMTSGNKNLKTSFQAIPPLLRDTGDELKKNNDTLGKQPPLVKNAKAQWVGLSGAIVQSLGYIKTALSFVFMIGFASMFKGVTSATGAMTAFNTSLTKYSRDMKWSGQETKKFTTEIDRLQGVYTKIDMNETGREVLRMSQMYKLSNQEATKFLETSAVFTAAMQAEGRSTGDAALALKDYIDQGQGWQRRMAEIGVTQKNLKETGLWSGDPNDKKGLFAALDAVMKDMELDKMAKEIYTLSDAGNALSIALGQLLGSVLIPLTPVLIEIAQALLKVTRSGTDFYKSLPKWLQIGTVIGLVGGLVTVDIVRNLGNFSIALGGLGSALRGIKGVGGVIDKLKALLGLDKVIPDTGGTPTGAGGKGFSISTKLSTIGHNLKMMGTATAYAAAGIAAGAVLLAEAILVMELPLWVLAWRGKKWKKMEGDIKDGLDGVKSAMNAMLYLSPILILASAIGIAGVATGGVGLAVGLAGLGGAALFLVGIVGVMTEAIVLMDRPLGELAQLGSKASTMLPNAKKGEESIKLISSTFGEVAKIIVALANMQTTFTQTIIGTLGGAVAGAAAGAVIGSVVPGIGTGIGAVAGAIIGGVAGYIASNKDQLSEAIRNMEVIIKDQGFIAQLGTFVRKVQELDIPEDFKTTKIEGFTSLVNLIASIGQMVGGLNKLGEMNIGATLSNAVSNISWVEILANTNAVTAQLYNVFNRSDGGGDWVSNLEAAMAMMRSLNSEKLQGFFDEVGKFGEKIQSITFPESVSGGSITNKVDSLKSIINPINVMIDTITTFSTNIKELGDLNDVKKKISELSTFLFGTSVAPSPITGPTYSTPVGTDNLPPGEGFFSMINSFTTQLSGVTLTPITGNIDWSVVDSVSAVIEKINGLSKTLTDSPEVLGGVKFHEYYSFLQGMNEFIGKVNSSIFVKVTDIDAVIAGVKTLITNINNLSADLKAPVNTMKSTMNDLAGGVVGANNRITHSFAMTAAYVIADINKMTTKINEFKRIIGSNSVGFSGGSSRGSGGGGGTPFIIPLLLGDNNHTRYSPSAGGYAGCNMLDSSCIVNAVGNTRTNFTPSYWNNDISGSMVAKKFKDTNFPYKGNTGVAASYISDVIGKTSYDFYFDDGGRGTNYKAILDSGHFNCWQGAHIIGQMASGFGLGWSLGRGTWNGIPHVWANVQGIGPMDATMLQQTNGASYRPPAAGGLVSHGGGYYTKNQGNNVYNRNNVEVNLDITLTDVGNTDEFIDNIKPLLEKITQDTIITMINKDINGE